MAVYCQKTKLILIGPCFSPKQLTNPLKQGLELRSSLSLSASYLMTLGPQWSMSEFCRHIISNTILAGMDKSPFDQIKNVQKLS